MRAGCGKTPQGAQEVPGTTSVAPKTAPSVFRNKRRGAAAPWRTASSYQLSAFSYQPKTKPLPETAVLHSLTVSVSMCDISCTLLIMNWLQSTQFHSPFFEGRDQGDKGPRDRGTEGPRRPASDLHPGSRGEGGVKQGVGSRGGGGGAEGVKSSKKTAVSHAFFAPFCQKIGHFPLICGSYRVWIRVLAGTREWPAPQPSEPTVFFHCAPEGRNYLQNGGKILGAGGWLWAGSAFAGTDLARPWASSCQLRSGVSPVPKSEGSFDFAQYGHPRRGFWGRRDRGHPPKEAAKKAPAKKAVAAKRSY